ncbi:MAG: sulfite exporter TauE/SafE family protein, partial [Desulfovibrionaceae bacterium]|nr:sulfite exporter TauE/SafE family protein [Desulfovibrionaceae bacterium]
MYFPVAGIEVSPVVPPLVAFAVSFVASMGGVSGAFLLLPFQMSVLGYTQPSVSATNQFFNVVAIPSGVYRFIKEKRMVWPLTIAVAVGTLPGVFIGAFARVVWLPDPRQFKLFAAAVLMYIGVRLVRDLLKKKPAAKPAAAGGPAQPFEVQVLEFSVQRISYTFQGETHTCPTLGIFILSFIVGIVGGTYGIGGGAIIAPFFVAFFRLPVHTIAGATLMGTFLTSVAGVLFFMMIAPFFPEQSVAP